MTVKPPKSCPTGRHSLCFSGCLLACLLCLAYFYRWRHIFTILSDLSLFWAHRKHYSHASRHHVCFVVSAFYTSSVIILTGLGMQDEPDPTAASGSKGKSAKQTATAAPSTSQTSIAAPVAPQHSTRHRRSRLSQVSSGDHSMQSAADPEAVSIAGKAQHSRSSTRLAKTSDKPAEAKAGAQPARENDKDDVFTEANVDCTAGAKPNTSRVQQGAAGPVADKGTRTIEELAVRFSQATKELQVCQA